MTGTLVFDLLPQSQVLVFQPRRLRSADDRIAGQTGAQLQLILFHEILHFIRVWAGWRKGQVTLEMVESMERVVHLVVVEQSQPVVDVGRSWRIIQRALVKRDRAQVISIRRFVLGVLDDLRAARSNHPVTASATERKAERQRSRELLQGIFDHQRPSNYSHELLPFQSLPPLLLTRDTPRVAIPFPRDGAGHNNGARGRSASRK